MTGYDGALGPDWRIMTYKRGILLDEVMKKSEPIVEPNDPSPALPGSLAYIQELPTLGL